MLSYAEIGPACILSRAVGGLIGEAVILVMPGSRAAVELAMSQIILPELPHIVREARKTTGSPTGLDRSQLRQLVYIHSVLQDPRSRWTTGYNNSSSIGTGLAAMDARILLKMEVETMMTRRVGIGLAVAVADGRELSARAADEKDGGDLKKLEGKWTTTPGRRGQGHLLASRGTS